MGRQNNIRLAFAISSALWALPLFPCASCGSGGEDPMVLYPEESWKTYLGTALITGHEDIDSAGQAQPVGDISGEFALIPSLGYGLSHRQFVTLTWPHRTRYSATRSVSAMGDPSLQYRFTLLELTPGEGLYPQIQLISGYRHGHAPAGEIEGPYIETFGNGYDDGKLGIDLWWGTGYLKPGFSYSYIFSWKQKSKDLVILPGSAQRFTLSLAYKFPEDLKWTVGSNVETRNPVQTEGWSNVGGLKKRMDFFGSMEWQINALNTLRVATSAAGYGSYTKDSTRTFSQSIGWLRVF